MEFDEDSCSEMEFDEDTDETPGQQDAKDIKMFFGIVISNFKPSNLLPPPIQFPSGGRWYLFR